jgi:hypothetical protein
MPDSIATIPTRRGLQPISVNQSGDKVTALGISHLTLGNSCYGQQTGVHEMVVEPLLIAIYSTWVTS